MCHLSAQPHTNINTRTHAQCTHASTHIQHKMQLSVQRCPILTEHAKRCAILALSRTQMQVCRYTHMHARTHTHTHAHTHTRMHTQHKVWLSVQRCAILTKHAKRCAFLALSHIQTYSHTRTHAQHKLWLSVQRCAILTKHAKRCAILALSHTQTYTHTHTRKHTHTYNTRCSCLSKDVPS